MATADPTAPVEARPLRKCTLQTHAGPVRLEVSDTGAQYHGTLDALLASGALTAQMLATRKSRSPNDVRPLYDEQGRDFRL